MQCQAKLLLSKPVGQLNDVTNPKLAFIKNMIKTNHNYFIMFIILLFTFGCSASPEKTAQHERILDSRIYSHERDAQMYRDLDNEEMASHFQSLANESKKRKDELNYGPVEFLLDSGIESIK